jgi:sulfate transport system permease protein
VSVGVTTVGSDVRHAGARRSLATKWALRCFAVGWLAALVAVPVGSIVYKTFEHGLAVAWNALTSSQVTASSDEFVHALTLTIIVTAIAVPLNTIFGVGTALLLARHRFPGARLLDAFIDLPVAVSPVVIGLALILVYGRTGWIGSFLTEHGIQVIFSVPGIVIASVFVSLPYVTREVLPVLQEIGTDQEQAAATLGAGPFTTLWRVTLPAIRWGVAYGVTLTTARVLGEFGAVLIVSGNITGKTETLTLFVGDQFGNENTAGAFAGALVLAVISLLVLAVLSISKSRKGLQR